ISDLLNHPENIFSNFLIISLDRFEEQPNFVNNVNTDYNYVNTSLNEEQKITKRTSKKKKNLELTAENFDEFEISLKFGIDWLSKNSYFDAEREIQRQEQSAMAWDDVPEPVEFVNPYAKPFDTSDFSEMSEGDQQTKKKQ